MKGREQELGAKAPSVAPQIFRVWVDDGRLGVQKTRQRSAGHSQPLGRLSNGKPQIAYDILSEQFARVWWIVHHSGFS